MITQQKVKELFKYNAEAGVLTNRTNRARSKSGDVAGWVNPSLGYRYISIQYKQYLAHRLIWLYVNGSMPNGQIDHINGVVDDNRIENLRDATRSENRRNSKMYSNNKIGFKGVTRNGRMFAAAIYANKKQNFIGNFSTPEDAHKAYCEKADELFGEFANHG